MGHLKKQRAKPTLTTYWKEGRTAAARSRHASNVSSLNQPAKGGARLGQRAFTACLHAFTLQQ